MYVGIHLVCIHQPRLYNVFRHDVAEAGVHRSGCRDSLVGREGTMSDKNLADAHWAWLSELLEVLYKGAFIHGFKHGVEHVKEVDGEL